MTTVSSNGHKRAVLYARVSTDEQAKEGYGLPVQVLAMRQYAEHNGFEIVKEFQEDYTGFSPFTERPAGRELMEMVKAKRVDAVIVHRPDRIARDSLEARIAARTWLKAGVELHISKTGRIKNDNDIVFLVETWKGQEDYTLIIENLKGGKITKARQGKVVGTARPPYGYHFVKDANGKTMGLEIYEPEARIVRLIFKWYVDGDEEGKTLALMSIGIRITEMGILAPRQNLKNRASGNTVWLQSTIQKIIKNETYCGVWRYRQTYWQGKKLMRRDPSEHIVVNVPSIIDRETWERAQARRVYNAAMAKRNGKREYLLRGRVRCKCGRLMYGRTDPRVHKSEHRIYVCNSRLWSTQTRQEPCHQKQLHCERVESFTWESIKELFSDLDRLWADLKKAQQKELDTQDPKREELKAVEEFIAQCDAEADEIAATMRIAKGRVGERVQAQQDDLNSRLEGYYKRRDELITALGKRTLTDDAIDDIMMYARDVREGLTEADFATKRRIFELLDVQAFVDDDKIRVTCVIADTTSLRSHTNGILASLQTPFADK